MKRFCFLIAVVFLLCLFATACAVEVGDVVSFGVYEQDNCADNGPEPLEWQVISINEDNIQMISVMGLDRMPYHNHYEPVTWAECSLRAWLNGEFIDTAFTQEEKNALIAQTLVNEDNTSYKTVGGEDTEDFVYILSANESKKLMTPAAKRQLYPTAYAVARKVYAMEIGKNSGICWWWVRNPGSEQDTAMYIKDDGSIFYKGIDVDYLSAAVRPVIHVDSNYYQ